MGNAATRLSIQQPHRGDVYTAAVGEHRCRVIRSFSRRNTHAEFYKVEFTDDSTAVLKLIEATQRKQILTCDFGQATKRINTSPSVLWRERPSLWEIQPCGRTINSRFSYSQQSRWNCPTRVELFDTTGQVHLRIAAYGIAARKRRGETEVVGVARRNAGIDLRMLLLLVIAEMADFE
jgi:hypothetical protein